MQFLADEFLNLGIFQSKSTAEDADLNKMRVPALRIKSTTEAMDRAYTVLRSEFVFI